MVERVETFDHVSRNRFVTRYAYHHGYFDGDEREFRGFGMVEQWDTEELSLVGGPPRAANDAVESHVPAVHTKTWFHTGVYVGRQHVSDFFAGLMTAADRGEYFREPGLTDDEARDLLLPDTVLPSGLSLDEEREACRALKGSMLRQEVYADDAGPGATAEQIQRARTPYTVVEQNIAIRTVQPRGANRHAVFLTHGDETISYHYERNPSDPRVQHGLTLEVDGYGNVLKQAAIGYGRRPIVHDVDVDGLVQLVLNPGLGDLSPDDQFKQTTALLTYTEQRVTNAVSSRRTHRTPLPSESVTFELTGYAATGAAGRFQAGDLVERDVAGNLRHRFTDEVSYEAQATGNRCRRPIEWLRTQYRRDDLAGLLPVGGLQSLALSGERYKLALTSGLLAQVFQRPRAGQPPEDLLPDPTVVLDGPGDDRGGYLRGPAVTADGLPATGDHWWVPSGRSFFTTNPADPPAGARPGASALLLAAAIPRPLRPRRLGRLRRQRPATGPDARRARQHANRRGERLSGPPATTRQRPQRQPDGDRLRHDGPGRRIGPDGQACPAPVEGDSIVDVVLDPTQAQLDEFFSRPRQAGPSAGTSEATSIAHTLLGGATTRFVYDLDRFSRTRRADPDDPATWEPAVAATIMRETHLSRPGSRRAKQSSRSASPTPTASAARSKGSCRRDPGR